MQRYKTPLFEPQIGSEEKKYVLDCIESNWISSKGKYIEKFEKRFSNFIKSKYSITVNNGTAALHIALLALGIKKGDDVIVPSFTYIAPVNAINYVGANVVFIDSKVETCQLDETKLEKMISKKTKAVIVPHLYGQMSEIKEIKKICDKNKIYLIEDAAEAYGCYYGSKHAGTFGHIGTFSFFGSKTITTGEGGMVVTDNKELAKKIYKYKTVGVVKSKNNYWHDLIGYNYRMTNLCAAIGLAQLEKTKKILINKKRVFENYKKFLGKRGVRMNSVIKNTTSSYWQITIFLKNKIYRDKLRNYLEDNRIETRTAFIPIHTMPMYSKKVNVKSLSNALILSNTGICLPSGPSLSRNQIMYICKTINKFVSIF
jgi:perosamine synthetase